MSESTQQEEKQQAKRSFFELIVETIGWIQIVVSLLLLGTLAGIIIYYYYPNRIGLIVAISIILLGLIIGIIWATRVWKKKGTTHFLSGAMATPDLDNIDEKK